MILDYFRFSISTFGGRKLRTALTILGIFIGIAAVVSLISLGQGMQNAVDEQFEMLGSNRITVTPGGGDMSSPMTTGLVAAKLHDSDVEVIRKVKGVDHAIGVLVRTAKIEYRGKSRYTMLFASSTDSKSIKFIENIDYFMLEEGRYPKESEKYKASVAIDTGNSLFDREIKRGEKITVNDRNLEVIAITKKTGNPVHDTKVTVPLDTARDLFGIEDEELSLIFVETSAGFMPADVAENIEDALRKDHRVKIGEEDFTVATAEQLIASFKGMLGMVQVFLVGIAFISLLVGGVGIMNTMYTSVLERTREIGIMKSIGARNIDVMAIFVIESGLLGLVGGVVGVIMGYAIGKAAEMVAVASGVTILKVFYSAELIIGALLFSFVIGSLSGMFPAIEASRKNPVDSLRYRR